MACCPGTRNRSYASVDVADFCSEAWTDRVWRSRWFDRVAHSVGGSQASSLKLQNWLPDSMPCSPTTSTSLPPSRLVVLPTDVVNAADRWPVSERAVRPSRVVVVEPVWQRLVALSMCAVGEP